MRSSTWKSARRSEHRARRSGGARGASPALLAVALLGAAACRVADASELDFSVLSVELQGPTPEAATGLAFGRDGEGYVSAGDTVYRFTPAADPGEDRMQLEPWLTTGAPRGHAILATGDHVLCDGAGLFLVPRDGQGRAPLGEPRLASPEDACVAPGGEGVLVVSTADGGGVLSHVALDTGKVTVLDGTLAQPTGLALAPDGRTLYVTESLTGRVLAYQLSGPGAIASRRELTTLPLEEGGPADVCVDADGFLWIARGAGIDVLAADGRLVVRLPTPASASLAFGDASLRVLYLAGEGEGEGGGGAVRSAYVGVRGAALPAQRGRK